MMKKCCKIFVVIFSFFFLISNLNAETLKELKDQLAKDQASLSENLQKQKEVQAKIEEAHSEIEETEKQIEDYQNQIDESIKKIEELQLEIEEKQKEINSLLSLKQLYSGNNVYLEYIFEAKTFTDFIYRSALVEQLTDYNDKLIDEMNDLIEENKRLQEELQVKIGEQEKLLEELDQKLQKYNVSLSDINKAHTDLEADIKTEKETVSYYEKMYKENNCSEDKDLIECLTNAPNSTGFVRPTNKGRISSDYGWRNCPVHGSEFHGAVDIAISMESNVYAAANGVVSGITRKSSCGGNVVYINHTVNGVKYRTVYMHLAQINVDVGDVVFINTVIGLSGGGSYTMKSKGGWDGCSTGAHLDFRIYKGWSGTSSVNPRTFISMPSSWSSRF